MIAKSARPEARRIARVRRRGPGRDDRPETPAMTVASHKKIEFQHFM
jgi:hypothetical protein